MEEIQKNRIWKKNPRAISGEINHEGNCREILEGN